MTATAGKQTQLHDVLTPDLQYHPAFLTRDADVQTTQATPPGGQGTDTTTGGQGATDDEPIRTRTELTTLVRSSVTEALDALAQRELPPYGQGRAGVHSSRQEPQGDGFSLIRAAGVLTGRLTASDARYELDLCGRLGQAFLGMGFKASEGRSMLIPCAASFFPDDIADLRDECIRAWSGFTRGYDPDEARWWIRKLYKERGDTYTRDLSGLSDLAGGVLLGMPEDAGMIPLLRNSTSVMRAGARILPMMPNGRARWWKQTGAATGYWLGEQASITKSNQTTGWLDFNAKKCGARENIPNELFRFAGRATEALVRADLAMVLGLLIDKAALEGQGTGTQPRGITGLPRSAADTTTAGKVQLIEASTTGTNGDTVQFDDGDKMMSFIEEANGRECTGFLMRPLMRRNIFKRRADAVSAADSKGPYLYIPGIGERPGSWYDAPIFKTTQITNDRVKGSGTNLSYILGGHWPSFMIAMMGAIELATNPYESTAWAQDATEVRAINHVDCGVQHEEDFAMIDNLLPTT